MTRSTGNNIYVIIYGRYTENCLVCLIHFCLSVNKKMPATRNKMHNPHLCALSFPPLSCRNCKNMFNKSVWLRAASWGIHLHLRPLPPTQVSLPGLPGLSQLLLYGKNGALPTPLSWSSAALFSKSPAHPSEFCALQSDTGHAEAF